MHVVARARLFLASHRWAYWAIVAAIAAFVALAAHAQFAALDEARAQWDNTQQVLVADIDLNPGDPLELSSIELPLVAVPSSAVAALPDGAQLRQRVAAGEVLVATDLTQVPGPAARAAPGAVVVGLTDPLSRDVSVGLAVQVSADGIVLAPDATVVEVVDDVVFVAVGEQEAPAVAAAAHAGLASLLYLP